MGELREHIGLLFLARSLNHRDRMLRIAVALCILATCWAQDCQVANIKVMQNFDRNRHTGTWYAVAKKDPIGLFLLDNVVANFKVETSGEGEEAKEVMTATAVGRFKILNNWETCANMFATFEDTHTLATVRPTKLGGPEVQDAPGVEVFHKHNKTVTIRNMSTIPNKPSNYQQTGPFQ